MAALMAVGAVSCGKEAPFSADTSQDKGRLLATSFKLSLNIAENMVRSNADAPDVSDFDVAFYKDGEADPEFSYKYGEMPEIVLLPVGSYVVRASYGGEYGDGVKAAFDAPFYLGESNQFSIEKDKVTDDIGTVVCRLSNVKVSILFDPELKAVMDADAKVSVTVGTNGTALDFSRDNERSGYFEFAEGSTTLAATFSGNVEDEPTTETKTYDNVSPGNHYRITFKLHRVDPTDPGDIGGDIKVDASVTIDDKGEISSDPEEEPLPDDRYPEEDPKDPDNPENPDTPDNPDVPKPGAGPTVDGGDLNLEGVNEVNSASTVKLTVTTESQFKKFEVTIISDALTPDELAGVGLAQQFDLIDPKDTAGNSIAEMLNGLGLPTGDAITGSKSVEFDISGFMMLLGAFGEMQHDFKLAVTDESGTREVTLQLLYKE